MNVSTFVVDLSSQQGRILALVDEIIEEDSSDSSRYKFVVVVVEVNMVHKPVVGHVQGVHHSLQLVDEVHLEIGCDHKIEPILVREGYGSNRRMSLAQVYNLDEPFLFASFRAPKVDLLGRPCQVDLVVKVLDKADCATVVAALDKLLFHPKEQWRSVHP